MDNDEISDLRYDIAIAYGADPYINNLLLRANNTIYQLNKQLRAAEAELDEYRTFGSAGEIVKQLGYLDLECFRLAGELETAREALRALYSERDRLRVACVIADEALSGAAEENDRLAAELETAREALALAKSMILSGERMSDQALEMIYNGLGQPRQPDADEATQKWRH